MALAEVIDHPEHRVDGATFKLAMRHLAGAVSVITTGDDGERTGFTATSLTSLSADSPSIVVSVNRSSSSWPVLLRTRRFAVNILADDQQSVADNFAGRGGVKGEDRYQDARWFPFQSGSLGLAGALVSIDCALEEAIERHSHALLIGAVREVVLTSEAHPLLYWHGAYRRVSDRTA